MRLSLLVILPVQGGCLLPAHHPLRCAGPYPKGHGGHEPTGAFCCRWRGGCAGHPPAAAIWLRSGQLGVPCLSVASREVLALALRYICIDPQGVQTRLQPEEVIPKNSKTSGQARLARLARLCTAFFLVFGKGHYEAHRNFAGILWFGPGVTTCQSVG